VIADALAVLLMLGGAFFLFAGTVGYIRLPDFFTRMHAIGKSDTLGALLSLLGVACCVGWSLTAFELAVVAIFIFVANPTATHALSRAAFLSGVAREQTEERSHG
jgi:multicomponent Na+:H+ antiporter subunit G